jgi:hypothetical protein
MTIHVSGRVRLLFDRTEIPVGDDPAEIVTAFRCRWCGFTVVTDAPDDLPDHGCSGPSPEPKFRGAAVPPLSHSPR